MQWEVNDKFDERLGPNPWRFISLLLPLLFRTADGIVEVAVDSITVLCRAFPDVLLQIRHEEDKRKVCK